MIQIKIHFDGVYHVKMEFPETEFHMTTDNLLDFKKEYLKFISNTFDMATSSDLEEIKEKEKICRKQNKIQFDSMLNNMINKYYDLQVFGHPCEINYSPHNLKGLSFKIYKNVKLVNVNGLGTGQVHFIMDDGKYLLLPWCYIVSMVPSKVENQKYN